MSRLKEINKALFQDLKTCLVNENEIIKMKFL